ncbi:hypothetical protein PR048_008111 [Dryococelus australis]|uniref:Integrase catalytic domain-containing protein n=1 Tax=Dryococelus australis TaxID=614101 RepID=A0ABQ9HW59_9NEOP|nr:hypothetical protein PR048_008111 [Dryococelus australis]
MDTLDSTYIKKGINQQVYLQRKSRNIKFTGGNPEIIISPFIEARNDKTSRNDKTLIAFYSMKKFVSNRWKTKYVSNSENKTQSNKCECKFSLRKFNVNSTSDHHGCESDGGTTFIAANRDQNTNEQCLMSNSSTINFVMDLGATNHMINRKYEAHLVNTMDKWYSSKSTQEWDLKLTSQEGKPTTIKDVLSNDQLEFNLLSVKKIGNHYFKVLFDNAEVKILNKNSEDVVTGNLIGNLYMIKFPIDINTAMMTSNENLMHRRMCHSSHFPAKNFCDIGIRKSNYTEILEVVSSDVIGAITPPTNDSKRYIVTFIDHFSHFAVVYLLSCKSEVPEKFEEYEAMVTAKFGTRISRIHCDNGGEYSTLKLFIEFCKNPELNGLSERFNKTLLDSVKCMLLDSKVEKKFWG